MRVASARRREARDTSDDTRYCTVSYVSIERLKSCRIRPLQFLEEDTDERPDHSGVPSSLSKRNYSSIQERNGGRGGIT